MKAYLIDPYTHQISRVNYSGDFKDIYEFIKCDVFTCADFNEHGDTFYIDDEGLFKSDRAFFEHPGYPQPLAGYALVLGTNSQGEAVEPTVTLSELQSSICWYSEATIAWRIAGGAYN